MDEGQELTSRYLTTQGKAEGLYPGDCFGRHFWARLRVRIHAHVDESKFTSHFGRLSILVTETQRCAILSLPELQWLARQAQSLLTCFLYDFVHYRYAHLSVASLAPRYFRSGCPRRAFDKEVEASKDKIKCVFQAPVTTFALCSDLSSYLML